MSGLDKIKARILEEARMYERETLEQAGKEADKIVESARAGAEARKSEILDRAGKEAEAAERRLVAVAELEMRKQKLKARQDMVEEAFKRALEQMANMSAERYQAVLLEMILHSIKTGNEEIILSPSDREKLDVQALANAVNARLKEAGKATDVKLSGDTRKIRGGFILKNGDVEVNNSFETLLKMRRDQLEQEVAAALFR